MAFSSLAFTLARKTSVALNTALAFYFTNAALVTARIELSLRQRILIEHVCHRWHYLVLHQFIKFCFFSTT